MLLSSGALPSGDAWTLELKWDGCRAQLRYDGRSVSLRTRNGRECAADFPELAEIAGVLGKRRVTLDGELVCLRPDGRPDFGRLRHRLIGSSTRRRLPGVRGADILPIADADCPWCRRLPARIAAVDATFPQNRGGELQARYDDDNRLANLLLHGSTVALNDRITDDAFGNATIRSGPSEQHLANSLRHAYWSYQRLALLIAERRNPETRAEIERLYAEGWPRLQTITGPALKKAGRNGRCPCGSGRKVKDCHGSI